MATPSSPIEVRPHPIKGRALHATQSFRAGQVIQAFTPLLLLPSLSHLSTVCTHCLRPGTPRACSRCHAAYYCDGTCQAAGWKTAHSSECKVLLKLKPESRAALPTPVRALLQAILKPAVGAGVNSLEGHVAERRARPGWQDLEMMAMAACAFAGKGTAEEEVRKATELICKIQTNAFHRYDADLGQVGIFLEPTLAMANHSCVPNAMVQFIGRKAVLRAETAIQAGQEIEISYTDYTHPLPKRKEALAPYNFECQCIRCQGDLNVYQVCATSPDLDLNRISLVSDIAKLRQHPAAGSPSKQSSSRAFQSTAVALLNSADTPDSLPERRKVLQQQYAKCKPLLAEGLLAVAPLPQILTEMSIYYAEDGNFPFALATACYVATACDPYRYTAPFHPVRIKGLFMIVKLLSNTAASTASLGNAIKTLASKKGLDQKVQETLQDIDQVSLCQMLLILILKWAPAGYLGEWELSISAREMLDDIERLPGRERELSLINAWKQDARSDRSRAFFEYGVVQQVDALAALGRVVLEADFEGGKGTPNFT